MTETRMPTDVPTWFDPMNPGPGFTLEPGVANDEELWYRSQFNMNGFDLPQWQPVEMAQAGYDLSSPASGKTSYQQVPFPQIGFHNRPDKVLPRFDNLHADNSTPYSLDDLLRTASQLATERALYMNIPPPSSHTPGYHQTPEPGMSSPAASPSHHSNASDTDDHELPAFEYAQVYQLPEADANNTTNGYFPSIHLQSRDHVATAVPHSGDKKAHRTQSGRKNSLTPLEMPDGTTRFTANWLPVDPQGGFTIRPPESHPAELDMEMMMDCQTHFHQDHAQNNYNYRNAFISLEKPDAGTEAGV
ncbi:hypothetical protein BJY04DRAFT_215441 [Aspergillus karnatakaensis]|uniref:uncharacterized protein n=1 Tax=Aspergillus karnatakaensis TaxID=1810916 RepID=UPI003CCDAD99